jgi:hypothetical protein
MGGAMPTGRQAKESAASSMLDAMEADGNNQ